MCLCKLLNDGKTSCTLCAALLGPETCDRILETTRLRDELTVPSVFRPNGRVKRRLVPKEMLSVLDFPGEILGGASERELRRWCRTLKVPYKIRKEVVDSVAVLFRPEGGRGQKRQTELESPLARREKKSRTGSIDCQEEATIGETELGPEVEDSERNLKAVKHDDAAIPYFLWDDRIRAGLSAAWSSSRHLDRLLTVLRKLACQRWKRLVSISCWKWFRQERERREASGLAPEGRSVTACVSAMDHASRSSWWDWDHGSSVFFWRFPPEWQLDMRDGLAPRFTGPAPRYEKAQRLNSDPEVVAKEKDKINKVRSRGYIKAIALVLSLTSYFSVDKGGCDIRMVYDASKSGLNDVLFAPWFALSTVNSMLRSMTPNTWSADNDFGEMFLNFWLHEDLQQYTGVDLTRLCPEETVSGGVTHLWEAWVRCAMGLTTSPYQAVQSAQRIRWLTLGDRKDEANVFRWERVRLNLPGDEDYDPSLPWVSKVRKDHQVAADVHPYVDDLRETAPTKEEAWQASSKVAKSSSYHGAQDAGRKRRDSSQTPGAWSGAMVEATGEELNKLVSQERWEKTKDHVRKLGEWKLMDLVPRKALERTRGFLVYVAMTYAILSPFLKGVHMSLESWREDRDEDGWRLFSAPTSALIDKFGLVDEDAGDKGNKADPPSHVAPVPRFKQDVEALEALTAAPTPPRVAVRPSSGCRAAIMFGDASGSGFGTSFWLYNGSGVSTEHGEWTREYGARSSNFREFYNLARRVQQLCASGKLPPGTELFIFTDNSTAEAAFYKGNSSSRYLFELVLMLRKLEMEGHLFLHIIWVAGTRMICQGTDGLSRGELLAGVMAGEDMLSFVPLNRGAFERAPEVVEAFLRSTLPDCCAEKAWNTLTPEGWYDLAFEGGNSIWAPPPAAADAALDQLCDVKLIRPRTAHMFVCPALMSYRWRRKLGKVCDLVFTLPKGNSIWGASQHEPLIVGLICPFLSSSPWQVRFCLPHVSAAQDALRGVWSAGGDFERASLREFWVRAWDGADL